MELEKMKGSEFADDGSPGAADIESARLYWRAANYLSCAQLYLASNCLLREPLRPSHFKPNVLGHWGTSPGINFIYAHLSDLARRAGLDLLTVIGPGHAGPALLSNLYLEGTLGEYYPELSLDAGGLERFINSFAWGKGFQTEISPHLPGVIYAGGELGPSLAVAQGAALDNPDLFVACVIGDGEVETGPLACAWQGAKFLHPSNSGAVLPIVNLNGFKMGSASLLGLMSDDELLAMFSGLGYEPHLVRASHAEMSSALTHALRDIRGLREEARSVGSPARRPMLVVKTPKGWTGVKQFGGRPIEGAAASHKAPLRNPRNSEEELRLVEEWLRGYRPEELFDDEGRPRPCVLRCLPPAPRRLGRTWERFGPSALRPLRLPKAEEYAAEPFRPDLPSGAVNFSRYLGRLIKLNGGDANFRIFSPDELSSNRLTEVLREGGLCFGVELPGGETSVGPAGRVMEVLSEHLCQGWLQGYLQTGRHGLFATYEAFAPVVGSMAGQYMKFVKESLTLPWRGPVASLNYFLTSLGWSNCYTHQNPDFAGTLLARDLPFVRVYTPPDANGVLASAELMLAGVNCVNALIAGKTQMPVWQTLAAARAQLERGFGTWEWAGSGGGGAPDVVASGVGDCPTAECLAALHILRESLPQLRTRYVSVSELTALASPATYAHAPTDEDFAECFTDDRPVLFNFVGYPYSLKPLLFERPNPQRFRVFGYREEGTTTTSFDMFVRNGVSRFHLAVRLAEMALPSRPELSDAVARLREQMASRLAAHGRYVSEHRVDPPWVSYREVLESVPLALQV